MMAMCSGRWRCCCRRLQVRAEVAEAQTRIIVCQDFCGAAKMFASDVSTDHCISGD